MKPSIYFRADGGTSIGMGHIVRCLALAEMLKEDFQIVFSLQKPDINTVAMLIDTSDWITHLRKTNNYIKEAISIADTLSSNDIVVLDGYNFNTQYQQIIKNSGFKLVCIDDLHAWHQVADVVINHAEGVAESDYSAESYTKFCLGLNYVLLRPAFLKPKTTLRRITSVKKVFISMGAADINNITQKFTEALIQIKGIEEIHLMLGAINPNLGSIDKLIAENKHVNIIKHFNISAEELATLLKNCDVSICPASSISLESSAIGIGLVSGYTAVNQLGILNGLINHNAAISFGDMNLLSDAEIKNKFESIANNPEQLNEIISNQSKMIDGKSPERLRMVFKNLSGKKKNVDVHFRFAEEKDTDLYFNWANDDAVRANSFNQEPIVYENHVKWFHTKLKSEECFFYLFLSQENKPAGQVRIDKIGDEVIIGISVDKEFRGYSLGAKMLVMACDDYLKKQPRATIIAYIKKENTDSLNIFVKAGFSNIVEVMEHNSESYKLTKKLS